MPLREPKNGESFDQYSFFEYLQWDAKQAKRKIDIESGFVAVARIQKLALTFVEKIQSGVPVCVFIDKPNDWDWRESPAIDASTRAGLRSTEVAIDLLTELNVHVNMRHLHKKVIVIDNWILWEGSLNALSYGGRRDEHMRRWADPEMAVEAVHTHRLHECSACLSKRPALQQNSLELDLDINSIGVAIALRRKALGMPQAELAQIAGITRQAINGIESGSHRPNLETFLRITHALDRRLSWLPENSMDNIARILSAENRF